MSTNQKERFVLICLLAISHLLWGQRQYRFEQLSAELGFSQSVAYQMAQDSFGNIWTATEEGVIRFNSHRSFRYHTYRGLPAGYNNRIRTIFIDQDQGIWIGAENGVARYAPHQDEFEIIGASEEQPNLVRSIVTTPDGQLWVGGYNGLWRYRSADTSFVRVAEVRGIETLATDGDRLLIGALEGMFSWDLTDQTLSSHTTLPTGTITSILRYRDTYLLGTKARGVYRAPLNLQRVELLPLTVGNNPVHALLPKEDQGIYMGTDGSGLWELDADLRPVRVFRNDVDQPSSLSSDGVYDMLLDREGNLWVATYGGGVNLLNPVRNNFYHLTHLPNTQASIAHPFTRAILEDELGRVWFGTKNGISIWSPGTDQWQHLLATSPDGPPIVMTLTEDREAVWAGTYNAGLYRIDKQTLIPTPYTFLDSITQEARIFTSTIDADGHLWIGGINRPVQRIGRDGTISKFNISQIKSIIPASRGGVWVAGRSGLSRIVGEKTEKIVALNPGEDSFRYTTINALRESENGRLLLGTNGAGLLIYDPVEETVESLSIRDGLPSDIIQGILAENDETLWLSTTKGLVRIKMQDDYTIQVFDRTDGLLSTEYNYGSYARLGSGRMLFGGVEGVTVFDPADIRAAETLPYVVLEEFRLFNQVVEAGTGPLPAHLNSLEKIELRYDENAVTINFAGVLQATPAKVRYRWRLDGLNDRWSEPTVNTQTNFTNLEPGDYLFRVQAANRDGYWGPERQLEILVAPPWWATTVAYIVYGLLGIIAVLVLYRLSRFLLNKRNAEQQIAFFNNITHELKTPLTILLSSLESMTEQQPDQAPDGQQARKKIKSTVKRLNALFEQLLNFHKVTAGGIGQGQVSVLQPEKHIRELTTSFQPLLQERGLALLVENRDPVSPFYYNKDVFDKIIFNLVSNAVKYSRPGGTIDIGIARDRSGDLRLDIKDDGIGIPNDQQKHILNEYYRARNAVNSQLPGTGLGLMMVKSMIEQEGGSIRFTSAENVGTTFFLELKNREDRYQPAAGSAPAALATDLVEELAPGDLQDAKVLVVEDNDELRAVLVERLSRHFVVSEARNGAEGLQKAGEVFPDLIITDLIMPEMDGMEMCRAIQAEISLNHIPIFMLTVLHNSRQKVESIKNGVSEYMEKPIDFSLLLAKITNTLSWRQKMRQRYNQQTEIEQAAAHRNDREAQFINELEQFVLQEVANENFSVQHLCQHVGMSRTSLYMKLKNLIDLSPQDFIIHTRLKYARRLLTEKALQIKEVAYRCGFSNPKYFSTAFKKKFGESPRSFRKGLEV